MSDIDYKTLESSIKEMMRKAHRQPDLPKLEEEGLKPTMKKKAKEIGKVVDKIADDDYEKLKLAGEVMDQILGEGAESDDEETPKKGKTTCEHCGGTGMHDDKECEECEGTGKVDIGDQMEERNTAVKHKGSFKVSVGKAKPIPGHPDYKGKQNPKEEVSEDYSDHKKNKYSLYGDKKGHAPKDAHDDIHKAITDPSGDPRKVDAAQKKHEKHGAGDTSSREQQWKHFMKHHADKKGKTWSAEEVNISEVSDHVKARYIDKANREISNLEKAKDSAHKQMSADGQDSKPVEKHLDRKANKRRRGVAQARSNLTRPQKFSTMKGKWEDYNPMREEFLLNLVYKDIDEDVEREADKKRIQVKGPDGKVVWRNVKKQTSVSKKIEHDKDEDQKDEMDEGTRAMATLDKSNYKSKNLEYGTKQAATTYAKQTPGQSPGHDMDRDDVKKSAKPVVDGVPLPGGEIKKPKADKLTEETMADRKFDQPNIFGNNPAGLQGVMDAASKILTGVRDEETQAAATEEDHPIQKDLEAQKAVATPEEEVVEEGKKLDPVDKKELKGKLKDREDKDIDNDGDVDSSDKFLHKKRKAVSKAVKKDDEENGEVEEGTMVPGFMGADGKPTSKPTKKDYEANKEYQSMKKKGVAPKVKEEKLVHMCAKHVEHVEYGVGTCIPEMHTIVEQEDGTNVVTHYDVMFEDSLVQDVPVEELNVLEESHHGHKRMKKEEAPTKKQVRMAKGIAFDKRYKGGNMTGAVKAMDKINPKLSSHPKVSKALRHANEENVSEVSDDLKKRYISKANKQITDIEKAKLNPNQERPIKGMPLLNKMQKQARLKKDAIATKRRMGVRQARSKLPGFGA